MPYQSPLSGYEWTPDPSQAPAKYEPGSVVFEGWYLNPECTGEKFDFATHTMPAGKNDGDTTLTLYAKWIPVTHTVSFYLNQAAWAADTKLSTHPDVTVSHGEKLETVPAAPTNGSYIFVGWFYMDGEVEEYASSQAVGEIGQTYTAEPLTIPGFTYDSSVAETVVSGELTANGLELKLYYVRNE